MLHSGFPKFEQSVKEAKCYQETISRQENKFQFNEQAFQEMCGMHKEAERRHYE